MLAVLLCWERGEQRGIRTGSVLLVMAGHPLCEPVCAHGRGLPARPREGGKGPRFRPEEV